MKVIKNFDKVQENGNYKRLPDGGYIVGVKKVEDNTEKESLRLELDICKGEYKNWCQKSYDSNPNETKYWPREGVLYRSYKDSALSFFKGFITSVTKSNKGFTWDWQEQTLVNKVFGVVIATEQYRTSKGKVVDRPYIASVHSVEAIEKGDFEIPPKKLLDISEVATQPAASSPVINPFGDSEPTTPAPDFDNNPFADTDDNPWS